MDRLRQEEGYLFQEDGFTIKLEQSYVFEIDLFDVIVVVEDQKLVIPQLFINKSESITVTESMSVSPPVVDLKINKSDSITLTENIPTLKFVETVVIAQRLVFIDGRPAILLFDGGGLPIYTYV